MAFYIHIHNINFVSDHMTTLCQVYQISNCVTFSNENPLKRHFGESPISELKILCSSVLVFIHVPPSPSKMFIRHWTLEVI